MDTLDVWPLSVENEVLLMYRGALVSGFVNTLVFFNKLANNF